LEKPQVLCHPKNGQFHESLNPQSAHAGYDITGIPLREIGWDIVPMTLWWILLKQQSV